MGDDRPSERVLSISAVLPACNEAPVLAEVARELDRVLAAAASRHEIIIVDDGSDDDTPRIADELEREIESVHAVHHPANRGYGAALRSGFDAAGLDWLFFTDADGQFKLSEIERLIPLAAERDLVVGFRETRNDPPERLVYGKLFSFAVRTLFGVKARDINCAFKLFKRDLIADADLRSDGALINAEIFVAAGKKGVEPLEVAVSHLPRNEGRATGGSLRVIAQAAREIFELWMRTREKV